MGFWRCYTRQCFSSSPFSAFGGTTAKNGFRFHGTAATGAKVAGLWGRYLRAASGRPLATAAATGATLWGTGDLSAQTLEKKINADGVPAPAPHENTAFDTIRLTATMFFGSAIAGALAMYWYNYLDHLVGDVWKFRRGGAGFVAAKVGIEFAVWHPFTLTAFWFFLGFAQGEGFSEIVTDFKKNFVPTLAAEYTLWTPIDILNFWLVPLHLQVLVVNLGCFLEAVGLSYIHGVGFEKIFESAFGGSADEAEKPEPKLKSAPILPSTGSPTRAPVAQPDHSHALH